MTISGEGRKDGSESHLLQPQLLGFGGDSPFKKEFGSCSSRCNIGKWACVVLAVSFESTWVVFKISNLRTGCKQTAAAKFGELY